MKNVVVLGAVIAAAIVAVLAYLQFGTDDGRPGSVVVAPIPDSQKSGGERATAPPSEPAPPASQAAKRAADAQQSASQVAPRNNAAAPTAAAPAPVTGTGSAPRATAPSAQTDRPAQGTAEAVGRPAPPPGAAAAAGQIAASPAPEPGPSVPQAGGETAKAEEPTTSVASAPPPAAAPAGPQASAAPIGPAPQITRIPPPAVDRAPSQADQPLPPSFDVVRIEPNGEAIMAGRAPPGWEVIVRDGSVEIGRVTADQRGEWVLLPDKRLPPGSTALRLEARGPGGQVLESESVVVLVVPERAPADGGTAVAAVPAPPLAVEIPGAPAGRARLLQAPSPAPGAEQRLTIDIIEYDSLGDFAAAGRANAGTLVRLYLDDEAMGATRVEPDGGWRIDPEHRLRPGVHVLRADELDLAGAVAARIEVSFEHGGPVADWPDGREIIVVRGHTLWWIARRIYGRGPQYTVIFEANREQIRDPDLIYPGQIFALPQVN